MEITPFQEELMRTIIRFTLELLHRNDGTCGRENGERESCSVEAQTETGHVVINWDKTSCHRDRGQSHIAYFLISLYLYGIRLSVIDSYSVYGVLSFVHNYCLMTCQLNTLYLQAAMFAG